VDSQRSCPKSATPTRSRKGETRPGRDEAAIARDDARRRSEPSRASPRRRRAHRRGRAGRPAHLALVPVMRANEDLLGTPSGPTSASTALAVAGQQDRAFPRGRASPWLTCRAEECRPWSRRPGRLARLLSDECGERPRLKQPRARKT